MKAAEQTRMKKMASCRWLCFHLLLMGIAQVSPGAQKPNIVIILVDDMGYGDAGCYNPKSKIATLNIDRLASEGMRFTDAHGSTSALTTNEIAQLVASIGSR